MYQKYLFIGLGLLILGFGSITYAADSELTLETSDDTSGFAVKNLAGNTVMRSDGLGNVGIGATAQRGKLEVRNVIPLWYGFSVSSDDDDRGIEIITSNFNFGTAGSSLSLGPLGDGVAEVNSYIQAKRDGKGNTAALLLNPDGGNIGIGTPRTTSPVRKLDVQGHLVLTTDDDSPFEDGGELVLANDDPTISPTWHIDRLDVGPPIESLFRIFYQPDINTASLTTPYFFIRADNGNVGIGNSAPNRKLYVDGDAGGTTAWFNDSDARSKEKVSTIENALEKVSKLRGVQFEWKETTNHPEGKQIGFIAQEAQEIIPEMVSNKGDHLSMQYAPITALLVEAVKEIKAENEAIRRDNSALKSAIEQLKEKLMAQSARQDNIEAMLIAVTNLSKEKQALLDIRTLNN